MQRPKKTKNIKPHGNTQAKLLSGLRDERKRDDLFFVFDFGLLIAGVEGSVIVVVVVVLLRW